MRIVLSGGGSGGHITPLLAVVRALKTPDNQLHYIGLGTARERELMAGSGVTMHRIVSGKFRRYRNVAWWQRLLDIKTLLLNLIDVLKFAVGIAMSLWLLRKLRPDRVFIKGGYVGLPVGIAAWMLRIPFVIHESDSVPGLTNRILAKLTPHRVSGFAIPGFELVGNPVREEIMTPVTVAAELFGIASSKPIVLVFGGSLGSHQINETVLDFVREYDDFELIHITGGVATDSLELSQYHPYEFLTDQMPAALQLADVVVARAGANTLAELAALSKASIIVPHPSLSGGHQVRNAQEWAAAQAVICLEQADLNPQLLHEQLQLIIQDQALRQALQTHIYDFARPHAAAAIARMVTDLPEESTA